MLIRVETEAGHCGFGTPRRLVLDGREVSVSSVLDQWPGADRRYFKVRGGDGNVYIIRLDETLHEWELIQFLRDEDKALR